MGLVENETFLFAAYYRVCVTTNTRENDVRDRKL